MTKKAENYDELQSVLVDISDTLFQNRTAFARALAPSPKQVGLRERQQASIDETLDLIADYIQDVREAQEAFEGTAFDPFTKRSPNGATRSASAKPKTKAAGGNKGRSSSSAPRTKGGAGKVTAKPEVKATAKPEAKAPKVAQAEKVVVPA